MMPSFTVLCPANELRLDSTGVILSPGYPDSYPNLQMCAWSISVEKGYNISMFVEFFQTEKEFDVLQVYDGNHGSYFLDIHKFSGNTLTVHINVQYKQLFMLLFLGNIVLSSRTPFSMRIVVSLIIFMCYSLKKPLKCLGKSFCIKFPLLIRNIGYKTPLIFHTILCIQTLKINGNATLYLYLYSIIFSLKDQIFRVRCLFPSAEIIQMLLM